MMKSVAKAIVQSRIMVHCLGGLQRMIEAVENGDAVNAKLVGHAAYHTAIMISER